METTEKVFERIDKKTTLKSSMKKRKNNWIRHVMRLSGLLESINQRRFRKGQECMKNSMNELYVENNKGLRV